MDTVNYVNNTGKLINDHIKCSAKLDRVSITNLVLVQHLNNVLHYMKSNLTENDPLITEYNIARIEGYINCLKKEINFYPEKQIDNNCILTETENNIIQE